MEKESRALSNKATENVIDNNTRGINSAERISTQHRGPFPSVNPCSNIPINMGADFQTVLQKICFLEQLAIQGNQSFSQRIALFRKIFYDRIIFDVFIPGSVNISNPMEWNSTLAQNAIAYLASRQEIMINNKVTDIGHVFVAMDARYHGLNLMPPNLNSCVEVVTLVGDLGKIVADFLMQNQIMDQQKLMRLYNSQFSDADMRGDIDAIVFVPNDTITIVQNFLQYYSSRNGQQRQVSSYCQQNNFGTLTRSGNNFVFSNSPAAQRYFVHQTVSFSLYYLSTYHPLRLPLINNALMGQAADAVTALFFLKLGLWRSRE